jgi:hypothetical protein
MPAMMVPTSRLSPSSASPRTMGVRPRARAFAAQAASAIAGRGDHAELGVGETAGLGGLVGFLVEAGGDVGGEVEAEARDEGAGVGEAGGVGDGRAGGDDGGVVAGDVGDGERDDAGRGGSGGEAAALDGGEVLPDGVHFVDRGAGG